MSFDLAVWTGERPIDDASAAATYEALIAQWLDGEGLDPETDDPTPDEAI